MKHWYRTHKPDRRRPVFLGGAALGVLLAVAALAMIIIPSGAAGSNNKTLYTTTINGTNYQGLPTPLTAPGGASTLFVLHLSNDATSPNQLGSANITPPAGFTITAACAGTTIGPPCAALPQDSTWSSTLVQLRNLNIAASSYKDFAIQATAPCSGAGGQWSIYANQSNSFNSQPGNHFFPWPLTFAQTLSGACQLHFVNTVGETAGTTAVRTTKWGSILSPPTGDPIQVEVVSGGTHLPSPSGTVTITASGCTLTGGGPQGFDASGYATFPNLTVANVTTQTGCQLTATSSPDAGYGPATSNPFNVDPANLYFVTQPADAVVNNVQTTGGPLTDVKYGGLVNPPSGNPIEVGVETTDGLPNSQPLPFNGSGAVSMAASQVSGGTGTCAFTNDSLASGSLNPIAVFSNLKMANVATKCQLVASSLVYNRATSGTLQKPSFNVDQHGFICTGPGPCSTGDLASGDGNTENVTTNNFAGTITVNFNSPNSYPGSVLAACGNTFAGSPGASANTGQVILDPTSISGGGPSATVKVTVAKKYLNKPPSQGNPFIPICAGVHRVNLTDATIYPCNADPFGPGWTTSATTLYAPATCVSDDGLGANDWGILGAYNQNPHIPAQDPVITQWLGNPDGSRTFWISMGTVQPNQQWFWDWSHQPA